MLQNRLFFALASRSGFGARISDAVVRSSVVFCNSVSADRIVMAVSRLLRAVAAFVILLSFAAGSRKSYWSGCMKASTVICQQIFSILALVNFLLKILLITLLRVIPTMTFIHFLTGKSSGILSDISSDILFDILSGISSGI